MELFTSPTAIIIYIAIGALAIAQARPKQHKPAKVRPPKYEAVKKEPRRASYSYSPKEGIMTAAEVSFYARLQKVAQGRYLIFPQIHLSSLATNKTTGRYYKLGFQRINRRSVDYILADPVTLKAVYAVELDDATHDTEKGQYIDALKSDVLKQANIPLVRFRDIDTLSDDAIVAAFAAAQEQVTGI